MLYGIEDSMLTFQNSFGCRPSLKFSKWPPKYVFGHYLGLEPHIFIILVSKHMFKGKGKGKGYEYYSGLFRSLF